MKAFTLAILCVAGAVALLPQRGFTGKLPQGSTQIAAIELFCPKLDSVKFHNDGRLVVGRQTYRLSSGRQDTLVFTGAAGIAILRGEAQPDGNLYFDKSHLTVGGKDYDCVAI